MFSDGKYTTVTGWVWKGQKRPGDGTAAAEAVWALAGINATAAGSQDAGRAPKDEELVTVERVPNGIATELRKCEAGKADDRSKARFGFYAEAKRAQLTQEELFSLILGSDWYEESGAAEKGREQLWADIHRSYAKVEQEFTPVLDSRIADQFVFVKVQDKYLEATTRNLLTRAAVNAALQEETDQKRLCVLMPGKNGEQKPVPVTTAARYLNRESEHADNIVWYPGKPLVFDWEGMRCANVFVPPPSPNLTLPDPEPWLDHVEHLLPVKEEREHILNVLAFHVQHLDGKVNHAIVFHGALGGGKDVFFQPMRKWLAAGEGWRDTKVESMNEKGGFNSYLYRTKFLVVQESREMAFDASFALYNSLKTVIAAPPPKIEINLKNVKHFTTPNLVQVFFVTNYENGVYFEEADDRRYFVTTTAGAKLGADGKADAAYYARMERWNDENWPAVIGWLGRRDVSAFMPGAPPPETAARAKMFAETRPAAYGEIGAGLAQVEQPFTAAELSWGLSRAGKLTENIERALKQGSQALGRLLRSRGYERVEHKPYRDEIDADGRPTGKKRRAEFGLWYQPSEMDAEEAKRRWEARQHAPSPGEEGKAGLKVIKG